MKTAKSKDNTLLEIQLHTVMQTAILLMEIQDIKIRIERSDYRLLVEEGNQPVGIPS